MLFVEDAVYIFSTLLGRNSPLNLNGMTEGIMRRHENKQETTTTVLQNGMRQNKHANNNYDGTGGFNATLLMHNLGASCDGDLNKSSNCSVREGQGIRSSKQQQA